MPNDEDGERHERSHNFQLSTLLYDDTTTKEAKAFCIPDSQGDEKSEQG